MESLPTFPPNANQSELPPSMGDTPEYMIVDDPPNLAAASGPAPAGEPTPFEGETPEFFDHNNSYNDNDANVLPEYDGYAFVAEEESPKEQGLPLPEEDPCRLATSCLECEIAMSALHESNDAEVCVWAPPPLGSSDAPPGCVKQPRSQVRRREDLSCTGTDSGVSDADAGVLPEDGYSPVAEELPMTESLPLPEDTLTFIAEEEEAVDVDDDHDHEEGPADHNHEDGIANHTHHADGDFDHDHVEDVHVGADEIDMSKVGDMDPDKIIAAVPPPPPTPGNDPNIPPPKPFDPNEEWTPFSNGNSAETKEGEPAIENMIVRPDELSSSGTTAPTDMDSLEAEMEDFLNEEIEEMEGATTAGEDSTTPPPTDLASIEAAMEDFIEESVKEWNEVGTPSPTALEVWEAEGNEDSDEDGDEEEDEDGDEEEDNEDGEEQGEEEEDEDGDEEEDNEDGEEDGEEEDDDGEGEDGDSDEADEDENVTATPQIGEATLVPTDLLSIEAGMEDFIEESVSEWHAKGNSTAIDSAVEDSDEDGDEEDGDEEEDEDSDEEDENGDEDGNEHGEDGDDAVDSGSPKQDDAGVEGSQTSKPKGPEDKKDGFESLLDDDGTKSALFGTPTLSPTAKLVWNDAAPVFKPKLTASEECSLSSISLEACMKNTYMLGGAGSILLLILLCICRKCLCRSSRADERGQYRQVAAQYGDMKYDNTFSDDYSTGSAGDIELSLAEANG